MRNSIEASFAPQEVTTLLCGHSVVTPRWKKLDFQQETSDLRQSSRYCQIHKFSKILNVRRLTLSMIQNLLILQMFNDQVLSLLFSLIPLKIHQEGHKN